MKFSAGAWPSAAVLPHVGGGPQRRAPGRPTPPLRVPRVLGHDAWRWAVRRDRSGDAEKSSEPCSWQGSARALGSRRMARDALTANQCPPPNVSVVRHARVGPKLSIGSRWQERRIVRVSPTAGFAYVTYDRLGQQGRRAKERSAGKKAGQPLQARLLGKEAQAARIAVH